MKSLFKVTTVHEDPYERDYDAKLVFDDLILAQAEDLRFQTYDDKNAVSVEGIVHDSLLDKLNSRHPALSHRVVEVRSIRE